VVAGCISSMVEYPDLCTFTDALVPHALAAGVCYLLLKSQPAVTMIAERRRAMCCNYCMLDAFPFQELLPELLQIWAINHAWRQPPWAPTHDGCQAAAAAAQ
jgi:hypothetical protein